MNGARHGVMLSLLVCLAGSPATGQTVTATAGAVNGIVTDSSQSRDSGREGHPFGAVIDDDQDLDHGGERRLSLLGRADRRLRAHVRAGRLLDHPPRRHQRWSRLHRDGQRDDEPGSISDRVTVSGAAPVVDVSSTGVTTRFDAGRLATLPGSRDFFAVLGNTPGVAMTRMDVGGNLALNLQDYTAYGLRATTGVNRTEVEGIRVGGATGASDNYFSDYGSFAEIAIKAVGNTAAMPVPGILGQYVSKSGGNTYRGDVYADYQGDSWRIDQHR